MFEILSLTDYSYAGTCEWDDRIVHVVTFAPPKAFDPLNPVERIATAMAGSVLIDARRVPLRPPSTIWEAGRDASRTYCSDDMLDILRDTLTEALVKAGVMGEG